MYCIQVDCSIHLDKPKSEIWEKVLGGDRQESCLHRTIPSHPLTPASQRRAVARSQLVPSSPTVIWRTLGRFLIFSEPRFLIYKTDTI